MDDIKKLADQFLEAREKLTEQRRYIDYDMASHLDYLEKSKDGTVDFNLRVIHYKSQIEAGEELYSQYQRELLDISTDLKPLLIQVNATRENPLKTLLEDNRYHDTYLDENGDIQDRGIYTDMSK
ncbi:hypothetical protein SAMN06265348_109316 [Pedobacter westerhofensis]|uniref:Uncharacterized protein n=1 Tax=Pedobacter westerhofensis TaxID=425512 RepID=A0A521EZ41_9SPHI|nr:hypothetical protein [Pedobacter westerhofensis]SMO89165.1 hypothetical protein SAMN06265348_109316 [Pedobacter westerhofensis]